MFVRTTHEVYLQKATLFIEKVVEQVKDLQFFTVDGPKGGPIIMTQVRQNVLKNTTKPVKYCIFRLKMNTELSDTTTFHEIHNTCIA